MHPGRRGRRNARKPLVVQRSILPKHQLQARQIMTLAMVRSTHLAQTGSFMPVLAGQNTVVATPIPNASMGGTITTTATYATNLVNVSNVLPTSIPHPTDSHSMMSNTQTSCTITKPIYNAIDKMQETLYMENTHIPGKVRICFNLMPAHFYCVWIL